MGGMSGSASVRVSDVIRALFRWIYDAFSSEDRRSVSSNESRPERYRDQNQHADNCAVCECLSVVWQMKHEKYKCVPCDYRRCGNNSQKPALPLDSSAHILRPQWSVVFKCRCDRNDTKQEHQPRRDPPREPSKMRRQEETDNGETKRNNNRKKGNSLLVFRVAHFAPGCRAGSYARSRYCRCLFKSIKVQGVEDNPRAPHTLPVRRDKASAWATQTGSMGLISADPLPSLPRMRGREGVGTPGRNSKIMGDLAPFD